MIEFLVPYGPLMKAAAAFSMFSLRYILFAGSAYLLFYVVKNRDWFYRKIQQKMPDKKNIHHEIKYSLLSFLMFSGVIVVMGIFHKLGYTKIYIGISEHGMTYFLFTIIAGIFIHDTYFYWVHRMMHHPKIFRHVHKVHHQSHNPTPWAAFSFHPVEAFLEIAIAPIIVFTIPVHPLAMLTFSLYMIVSNVLGHLGFELFPENFTKHKIGKWLNSSTHHNMHHRYVKCNYGLYFNFWDRLMGTNHKNYHETFDEVKSRKKEENLQVELKLKTA